MPWLGEYLDKCMHVHVVCDKNVQLAYYGPLTNAIKLHDPVIIQWQKIVWHQVNKMFTADVCYIERFLEKESYYETWCAVKQCQICSRVCTATLDSLESNLEK